MDYQVEYDSVGKEEKQKPDRHRVSGVIAVVMVCVLVLGAVTIKTVGLPWVESVLIPGDPEITASAWQQMIEDLRKGGSMTDAVTAFCREIIENAN